MKKTIFRQGAINSLYNDDINIVWSLTMSCNYRCSYCFWGDGVASKETFSAWEQLKNAADFFISQNRSKYRFVITGGEPTIHPEFLPLMEYIQKNIGDKGRYLVISNGSRDIAFYKKLVERSPFLTLQISIHLESANIEKIINLTKSIAPTNPIFFSLMFQPDYRKEAKNFFDSLYDLRSRLPFFLLIKQLRMPPKFEFLDDRYTEDDIAWMDGANEKFRQLHAQSDLKYSNMYGDAENNFWDIIDAGERKILWNETHNTALRDGLLHFKNMWCSMGTCVYAVTHRGICRGAECPAAWQKTLDIYKNDAADDGVFPFLLQCPLENCSCRVNLDILKLDDHSEAKTYIKNYKDRMNCKN